MSERWYAVMVHARQEKAGAAALQEKGIESYLPLRAERRPWSDRIKRVEVALFPGYLFVRVALDAARRNQILSVRQVFDLLGRRPGSSEVAPIPDSEMDSLRRVVESARIVDPVEGVVAGQEVEVGAGPLKGVRGVVLEGADGARRLVVQIQLLGRGVRATLDVEDVLRVL